jgi:hypothetical protein
VAETLVITCPICRVVTDSPQADHDHATGQMRDWLCKPCNLGLGQFKDNAAALYRAALYIEKHQQVSPIEYLRHNANEFHRSRARRARKALKASQP